MTAAIWAAFVPAGGSSSVTVRWPGSPAPMQGTAMVHLSEWSGLATLGSEVHGAGTGGGPIATDSLVVKKGTGLLLALAAGHNVSTGLPTNGFTPLSTLALNDVRLDLAYVLAPPEGAYATTWAYPSTKGWEALLVSYLR